METQRTLSQKADSEVNNTSTANKEEGGHPMQYLERLSE
jgi:hypothetical protein